MEQKNEKDYFDLRSIIKSILAKWHWFFISIFSFVLVAFLNIKFTPNVYKVKSIIKLKTEESGASKILNQDIFNDSKLNLEDQIIEIKSTEYIKKTLDKLDFGISFYEKSHFADKEFFKDNFPLVINIDSSINQITGVPINIKVISATHYELEINGEEIDLYNFKEGILLENIIPEINIKNTQEFGAPIVLENLGITVTLLGDFDKLIDRKFYFILRHPRSLIDSYSSKLNIELAGLNSNILTLSTEGKVPRKEITFLDTLMEVITQVDLDEKNLESIKTIDFIDYQLAGVSESLTKVERDLESFQYSTTNIGESSALYEKRDELDAELNNLNVKLNYYKNILSSLESANDVTNFSTSSSTDIAEPLLTNLLINLTDLTNRRIQVGRTATEANPVVQRLDLEIRSTKNQLKEYLLGSIKTTNIMIEDVRVRLNQNNQMIKALPSNERRKLGIERQFEFTGNTYDNFLQKKADAGLVLATNSSNWKIIEQAKMDGFGPVSPNKKIIFAIFIFLGTCFPLLLIIITDFFNTKIRNKDDLRKISNIPVLGTIS
ncbi:MAG: hypothetical protein MI975_01690, partial [Cytophagales bacterium]|nr:hypothetical protein [Cytophagales bacterium]